MFADFQNMIKGKLGSLKNTSKTDITRTPQKYKIKGRIIQELKLLSEGSFGFIWLAEDVSTKQKFALKRIVCITNDRFLLAKNQLELMTKFPKCKNIVECFGGELVTLKNGDVQNKVFIILMEYCPNGTLFDLLSSRENKGFSQKQLLQIVHSILEGLKNIHSVGCYHQDVKIENVLIGEDHSYKLCDFGSCSNRFIDFRSISKTEYGHIKQEIEAMTTPMYRPPEIVDPYLEYEVSYKVDIWMTGCVLYTLAFFTHPFVDSNAVGIAGGVYRFPKYPEETQYQVSQKIKDLIRNMLTPNPLFRPTVQQAMDIINRWYTLSQIPLNKEALRRKQQERRKQKELQSLHRKVVDIDGDIPIEKLMELQKKLKTKDTKQIEAKTFVTKKIPVQNQGKPLFANNAAQNSFNFSFQQVKKAPEQSSKQKQDTISSNSFWNTATQAVKSEEKPIAKTDAFSDFFGDTRVAQKQKATSDIYDYFVCEQQRKKETESKPNKNVCQVNLLDL